MVILLPLRAILLQCLCLLVAIAIEAAVFHWELKHPYRRSMEYAVSVNILAITIGWIVFLGVIPLLDNQVRVALMSYVLFDRFPSGGDWPWVIISGFATFVLSFFVKWQGLNLLERLLERVKPAPEPEPGDRPTPQRRQNFISPFTRYKIQSRPTLQQLSNQLNVVLVANASSYTAILVILALRYLFYRE